MRSCISSSSRSSSSARGSFSVIALVLPGAAERDAGAGTVTWPARSVTVPIRRAPGWWASSSATAASAVDSGTTATKPQPMLKTSHISASATPPRSRDEAEDRRDGQRVGRPRSRRRAYRRSRLSSPPPVMCASPWTSSAGAQQLEHRAHVDHGRLEQRVGDRGAAERRRAVVEREAASSSAPRQRVAVGVQAARRQADERVARRRSLAGDDRVERDGAEAGGAEVEAVRRRVAADQLRQHRELAAGDLDAGLPRRRPSGPARSRAAPPGRSRSTAR